MPTITGIKLFHCSFPVWERLYRISAEHWIVCGPETKWVILMISVCLFWVGWIRQAVILNSHTHTYTISCLVSVNLGSALFTRNIECQKWIEWVFCSGPSLIPLLINFIQPKTKHQYTQISSANRISSSGTKSRRSALTLPCHFSDGVPVWTVPKSPSGELLKNGGLTPLQSAEPSPALSKRSVSHGAEVRNITSS